MKLHFIHFLAILSLIVLEVASEKTKIKSVFPNRTSPPGLKSPRKCWWAKEITPDFHVSGRLTERQIKYAADCGFKSIVSLFTYPDNEPPSYFGGDYLPSTTEAKKVTEEIAGMKYINLLDPMDEWASVEAVFKMTKVLSVIPKPVLLHCDRGYTIAFVTLLYLANQTQHDPASTPKITSTDFYNITAAMGLNFVSRIPQEVVSEITGEPVFHDPPQVETEPEDWKDYWVAHPVYKNWYVGGQITKSHLPVMEETGFTSVINMRSGIILNGMPNQEEVNLLNIKSNTGTYASGDKVPRQHTSRLEETRIDPNRPNYFISPNSTVNYESRNYDEFGDEVGYQELTERLAFASSSLKYYHLPVGSDGPYTEYVNKVIDQFQDIGKKGPVFVHCASGKRAAHVAVLAAALQYDKDLEWALRRNQELGFDVSKKAEPEVYGIYVNWLVTKRGIKDEL